MIAEKAWHFTKYWQMWSRRLAVVTLENGHKMAVDFTVYELCSKRDASLDIRVRVHCTQNEHGDKDTDTLPDEIVQGMINRSGEQFAAWALTVQAEDIDLEGLIARKYPSNGGVLFNDCQKK